MCKFKSDVRFSLLNYNLEANHIMYNHLDQRPAGLIQLLRLSITSKKVQNGHKNCHEGPKHTQVQYTPTLLSPIPKGNKPPCSPNIYDDHHTSLVS